MKSYWIIKIFFGFQFHGYPQYITYAKVLEIEEALRIKTQLEEKGEQVRIYKKGKVLFDTYKELMNGKENKS